MGCNKQQNNNWKAYADSFCLKYEASLILFFIAKSARVSDIMVYISLSTKRCKELQIIIDKPIFLVLENDLTKNKQKNKYLNFTSFKPHRNILTYSVCVI